MNSDWAGVIFWAGSRHVHQPGHRCSRLQESSPGATSALDDLLQQCWQISPSPLPGSEDAARVEAFAAWPQGLPAPGWGLFRTSADAVAAFQTAPRLQARGDFHCTDDSRVCVYVDSEGPGQLRSVAHIQQLQVRAYAVRALRAPFVGASRRRAPIRAARYRELREMEAYTWDVLRG